VSIGCEYLLKEIRVIVTSSHIHIYEGKSFVSKMTEEGGIFEICFWEIFCYEVFAKQKKKGLSITTFVCVCAPGVSNSQ
jgi:predicted transcriptional regulator